jgi:hypothetical protein
MIYKEGKIISNSLISEAQSNLYPNQRHTQSRIGSSNTGTLEKS